MIGAPESTSPNIDEHIGSLVPYVNQAADDPAALMISGLKNNQKDRDSSTENDGNKTQQPSPPAAASLIKTVVPLRHPCENFAFPPPPPRGLRRPGPRRKSNILSLFLLPSSVLIRDWNVPHNVIKTKDNSAIS